MRFSVLIVVFVLQVHTLMAILTHLAAIKGKLINSTGNAISKAGSTMYKLGSLVEIFGDTQQQTSPPEVLDPFHNLNDFP
uniref:Uncharacterized protein LOC108038233 n=1 Tax=Drosophila rhopaloa TaxID=1041015 RepID=A0A6P4EAW3_DRORH